MNNFFTFKDMGMWEELGQFACEEVSPHTILINNWNFWVALSQLLWHVCLFFSIDWKIPEACDFSFQQLM